MPGPVPGRAEEQPCVSDHSDISDPKEDHWVQCDRCNKWRRVPKRVADTLEDDATWCVASLVSANTGQDRNLQY